MTAITFCRKAHAIRVYDYKVDGAQIPAKVVAREGHVYSVKGIKKDGTLLDIKAVARDGALLDVKAVLPAHGN